MSTNDQATLRHLLTMLERGAVDEDALLEVKADGYRVRLGKMDVRVEPDGALVFDVRIRGGEAQGSLL